MPTAAVPLAELLAVAQDYERRGQTDVAGRLLQHLLAAAPGQPEALHLAGIVAFRQGRPDEALALIQRAIALGIDTPLYLRNICEVYRTLGRLDEALAAAQRATDLAPNDPLCLHNQSIIHYHRLELDAALSCATRALTMDPQMAGAHFGRAETLLLQGHWAEGWDEYEWRFRIGGAAPLIPPAHVRPDVPQWDGTHVDGTLLLIADQGFGDVIQFARYIPWAQGICPDVAIAGSAEVLPMLKQVAPTAKLTVRWPDVPPYKAFAALSGLPRLHGTRPDTVPAPIPYLRAKPGHAARWKQRLGELTPSGLRRIGLVWAGRPTHNNDRNRSAGLLDYAPLSKVPGVALLTLQKGPKIDQAGRYFGRAPLINIGAEIADYDDTMGVLANLDLLVTVDTSVAHLAGAMGCPAWIMLPRAPDWRWLLDRPDTPWYPSVRLFRRAPGQDWSDVASGIAAALDASRGG